MESTQKRKKIVTLFSVGAAAVGVGAILLLSRTPRTVECVTVEAGIEKIDVKEFLEDKESNASFETDVKALPLDVPGEYEVQVKVENKVYESKLKVEDTTAPKAVTVEQKIWNDEKIEAKEFVKDIEDVSEVKVYYKEEPDFSKPGSYEVVIVLEDTSNNKTELTSKLLVMADTEAPEITGAANQTVYVDSKVAYKNGVTVKDNKDENIQLVVDSSAVNLKKPGSYEVVYSAKDAAGNTTYKKATITVKEKQSNVIDEDIVYNLADQILTKIIKEGMTQRQKARAIFDWIGDHLTYVNSSDKSSWIKGAYTGIKKGSGDCFTYYATAKAMLTRAGFQNRTVTRIGGGHYWNLVYVEGGWYHFDSSPRRKGDRFDCFLKTDAEVAEYSKSYRNYYNFDKSLHPATPVK